VAVWVQPTVSGKFQRIFKGLTPGNLLKISGVRSGEIDGRGDHLRITKNAFVSQRWRWDETAAAPCVAHLLRELERHLAISGVVNDEGWHVSRPSSQDCVERLHWSANALDELADHPVDPFRRQANGANEPVDVIRRPGRRREEHCRAGREGELCDSEDRGGATKGMAHNDLGIAEGAGDESHRAKELDEGALAPGRSPVTRHIEDDGSPPSPGKRPRERLHVAG
jgi:hypothetical protein